MEINNRASSRDKFAWSKKEEKDFVQFIMNSFILLLVCDILIFEKKKKKQECLVYNVYQWCHFTQDCFLFAEYPFILKKK